MLKRLEVVRAPRLARQGDEIYLFRDQEWNREFVLRQVGVKGECCVRCAWENFQGLELVFANLKEARAEIEKLSRLPRHWLEEMLRPVRVVNA